MLIMIKQSRLRVGLLSGAYQSNVATGTNEMREADVQLLIN